MDIAAVLEFGDRAYALAEIENDSSEAEIRALLDLELAAPLRWDEPEGAASPRGWLFEAGSQRSLGFYLDYGPGIYRSPHSITRPSDGKVLTFCDPSSDRATRVCPEHQPGSVLAVVVDGPSRYVETVENARRWISARWISADWISAEVR